MGKPSCVVESTSAPPSSRMHSRARARLAGRWIRCAIVAIQLLACAPPTSGSDEREGWSSVTGDNVVLLHGLARSRSNMRILEWRLAARGYRVCNIGYDTRVASIEVAADRVFGELPGCVDATRRTHFVTHSLGGLVLRSLLARHELDRLGRAVMLAPPNRGSEIADFLRTLPLTDDLMGPLAGQLGTRREDLPGALPIPSIEFAVIAGNRWINPVGPLLLPTPHDGTVSVASTRLEGMKDHLVVPHTHTFIMNAAGVAEQVDAFLRTGRFERSAASATTPDARSMSSPRSRGRASARSGEGIWGRLRRGGPAALR